MKQQKRKPNWLINEKSPYLLQHVYNPVHWYPWGERAFSLALQENKPIFLSIGYSTCHWCHVMEKESFEDQEVAALLNRYFISIKVDREERPDVDHLYMEFCQALTGSGGWPLTLLMTPEKEPFFAGTYFPKNQRYGRPGLMELLEQVGTLWQNKEGDLRESAREILAAVKARKLPASSPTLLSQEELPHWQEDLIHQAYHALESAFDPEFGGFGRAPKFPSPHTLSFLLRYSLQHPESQAHEMAQKTLDSMGQGGIKDHIGFGFCRYSTDREWLVPHFEKMLYDNALLAIAYLESFQLSKREEDAQQAKEIFHYVLRDMTSPEGAFYSAEDADSEGVEGKFYLWSPEEVEKVLGEESVLFCQAFDITTSGNFEGKSIPNRLKSDLNKLAQTSHLSLMTLKERLETSRQALFASRKQRIHPHKDDKILTSWNALMIAALAKGAQVLGSDYLGRAEKALKFILTHLRREDGRLFARFRDGETAYLGYLDDYAYLIWSVLELYAASGQPHLLSLAIDLQEDQDELFTDPDGGYFLTGKDAESLLMRPKEVYDGALPSGNSVSALNLLRLARITADQRWEDKARHQIQAFRSTLSEYPSGYSAFLQALQFATSPSQELVLAGPLDSPRLSEMRKAYFFGFHPFATVLYQEGTVSRITPWVKDYPVNPDQTLAYLCQGLACQAPVSTPEDLTQLLQQ
ncbi:MAG: thioredoxin domain-containing protein [Desulfitobacteriaceae bacterium]|nr:thioredoxin domain-containing protein [Desulfitobacteriaceae bacterium]MDI6913098.1 thioredoxin domain-containing protein [Desulfitobacteriaceae bacterium]